MTAFCTPNGLDKCLGMPQSVAGAPALFVSVMRFVTTGLENVQPYLDDAIESNDSLIIHVVVVAALF